MMERYEDLIINNSKALALAEQIKDKRKNQIKIEFFVKDRYHAVWVSEEKIKKIQILTDQKGITIQQYYINKYS